MPRKILWLDAKTVSRNLKGNIYIVTGANSGIGLETTRQLVKQGAHVIMACRRSDAAKEAAKGFENLSGTVDFMKLDLADFASVRSFAQAFKDKYDHLNGLANNAGMLAGRERKVTKDGFEVSYQVSFLGHFLLTELLLDVLKKTRDSRIVMVSSVLHAGRPGRRPDVHFEDLDMKSRKFNGFQMYGEVKVANVLYARELGDRLKDTNVSAYALHPGFARSNFGQDGGPMKIMRIMMGPFWNRITDSSEESAQTTLHCLLSEDAPKYSGMYFSQQSNSYNDKQCRPGGWPMKSPNPNANDSNKAQKLVEIARKCVGL